MAAVSEGDVAENAMALGSMTREKRGGQRARIIIAG